MPEPKHKITTKVLGDLRTVQADTYEEYQVELDKAIAGLSKDLQFVQMAHAVNNAAPLTQPQQPAAPAPAPAVQAQDWGQQAPVTPPAPTAVGADKTVCAHGQRVARSGTSQYGEWRAYFCPQPKGAPDTCEAIFLQAPGKKGHNPAEWEAHGA